MAKMTKVAMKHTEAKLAEKRAFHVKRCLIRGCKVMDVAMKAAIDAPIQTSSCRSTLERTSDIYNTGTPASAPRIRSLILSLVLKYAMPTPSPIVTKTSGLVEKRNTSSPAIIAINVAAARFAFSSFFLGRRGIGWGSTKDE